MGCSDLDFEFLRNLVHSESANVIDPSRNSLFERRLAEVTRLAGAQSLEQLVAILRADRPAHLHRAVAEAMTVNETSFFRDAKPFEAIRTVVLPRLIAARRLERKLRIWSAASSTGQEAYSAAILLMESYPELATWDVQILGTDISRGIVAYARQARYRRMEVNRGLPARLLAKYFNRIGDEWVVCDQVRSLCEFRTMNLSEPAPILPLFDLVLLRNVLLYFPKRDRNRLFDFVHAQMRPDGCLVLGNSEQAEDSTMVFRAEFARECYFYSPIVTT